MSEYRVKKASRGSGGKPLSLAATSIDGERRVGRKTRTNQEMRLQGIVVGELTHEHITALVRDRSAESRALEFKRDLPGHGADDRKEFLADVAAFANTSGGVIVYGIQTERDADGRDTGIASTVFGIGDENFDALKLRMSSMVHEGLSPSLLAAVAMQGITLPAGGQSVFVVGVSQSLARPHMVTYARTNKFWRRSDSGKYQPDVAELRAMFLETRSWIDEAEAFREARLARVRSGLVVRNLDRGSFALYHIVPLGRLARSSDLLAVEAQLRATLPPPEHHGYGFTFNADGFLNSSRGAQDFVNSYTQWLRFGGVEGYESGITAIDNRIPGQQVKQFWAFGVCQTARAYTAEALRALRTIFRLDPPFAIMITLSGLQDAVIQNDRRFDRGMAFMEDELRLPPVIVDDANPNIELLLKPALDVIWQAGGYGQEPPPPRR